MMPSKPSAFQRSLKAVAVGLLSRREHSRAELQRKLLAHAESPEQVETVLSALEHEGWLSNERFAASLVNRQAGRKGARVIVQQLQQHGVDHDTVTALRESLEATESERARAVWEKKFPAPPGTLKEYARQQRFLASRGFSATTIRNLLGPVPY